MLSLRKTLIITSIIYVTGFLFIFLYRHMVSIGVDVPIFTHYPGKCRIIPGMECGSEDTAVTKDGLAFISNGLRAVPRCNYTIHNGGIYIFDFKHPDENVTKLEIISETIDFSLFEPHGLSLWENIYSNSLTLYVVDHGISERVQVFEYRREIRDKLFHKKTIIDDNFVCINDLVLVNSKSFYITNWLAYCHVNQLMLTYEFFFATRTGSVVFYNGNSSSVVEKNLQMPNGINISPDGNYIYVASSSGWKLLVFERNESNSINLVNEFPLMTSPDNIEVDRDSGDLYIGAHRNILLSISSYDGELPAPAHVVRVRRRDENWMGIEITELLADDGHDFIRGTSVAHYHKGNLLVGTVFHRMAYCVMGAPP